MTKTNTAFTVFVVSSILFLGCNFYSDKSLGANYWFLEDGYQSEIVYGENGTQGSFTIVDANVSKYNFNDKYIIAESNWLKDGMDAYWIIDKRIKINKDTSLKAELYERELKNGLVGPLSKDTFELLVKKYRINLKLKSVQ